MRTIPQLKYCPRCKQVKPTSDFARHSRRADGLQPYCRACRREMDHLRYEREVGHPITPHAGRKSEPGRGVWLDSLKTGIPCTDCGGLFPHQIMQWDHRPGTQKLGDISADFWGRSRDDVLAEIAKCDLVCANCHAIRTFERCGWGRNWLKEDLRLYDSAAAA